MGCGVAFSVVILTKFSSCFDCRRDYLQVAEQDPFLPPSAASQAIAARTLRHQGSYHGPPPLPRPPTPPSPRYTPLPTAPSFRERLRDPSVAGSVYYDPTILNSDELSQHTPSAPEPSAHYDYYSSIPINSNLTSERRGRNYNSRDSELVNTQWSRPPMGYKYSPNSTLESHWTPD